MAETELTDYRQAVPEVGDLFTVEQFCAEAEAGTFGDNDGNGQSVRGGRMAGDWIKPSRLGEIRADATHVIWFNK